MKRQSKIDAHLAERSLLQQIQEIAVWATDYFIRIAGQLQDISPDSAWSQVSAEDQQLITDLARRIRRVVTQITLKARSLGLLNEEDEANLKDAKKNILEALKFTKSRRESGYPVYDPERDCYIGWIKEEVVWRQLDPAAAQQMFNESYEVVAGLLEEIEIAKTGTQVSNVSGKTPNSQIGHPSESTTPKGFDGLKQKLQDLSRYLDNPTLTARQREVASLKWEYGLNLSEIASRLGLHHSTVQEHINNAAKRMQNENRSAQRKSDPWDK